MDTLLSTPPTLLSLPVEIRLQILSYVIAQPPGVGFFPKAGTPYLAPRLSAGRLLDSGYSATHHLSILLTCRQIWHEAKALAFQETTFVIPRTWQPISGLFQKLHPWQLQCLRKIIFVVDSARLCQMNAWSRFPFDRPELRLAELSVVFTHPMGRAGLSRFCSQICSLLLRLENAQTLTYVLNRAKETYDFKNFVWRMTGTILMLCQKIRYHEPNGPGIESTWWKWRFDWKGLFIVFSAVERLPVMSQKDFEVASLPWVEQRLAMKDVARNELSVS